MIVDVVIPALDEAEALPLVLAAIPRASVRDVYVVDSGSIDDTVEVAERLGARVILEERRGYGGACLHALNELTRLARPPDVVLFLDGDFSHDPGEIPWLLEPLKTGVADMVIGSRALGEVEPGAWRWAERASARLATLLMRIVYRQRYTDVGRFRAIRLPALVALGMHESGIGWPVEMQVKAVRRGLRVVEVPVSYRRRVGGVSKSAGPTRGPLGQSARVVYTVVRYATAR